MLDTTKTSYEPLLESINGVPITSTRNTFRDCASLTTAPVIPNNVTNMSYTFYGCSSLTTATVIPNGVTNMRYVFSGCASLNTYEGSTDTTGDFSKYVIPENVTDLISVFNGCVSLTIAPVIPGNVTSMNYTFKGCTSLTGTITINATPTSYTQCFANVDMTNITLTGKPSIAILNAIGSTGKNWTDILPNEILDSWEEIINNVNNGTYATKYKVCDYKPLDLGSEGVINMQIAAIDADVLSGGSDNAHITWIAKELLATKHVMNSTDTNANGWAASNMRTYLANDIYALIPETVQNAIVAVDKTYYDYTTKSSLTCSDRVWIPSYREAFGVTVTPDDDENSGVIYSELFTNDSSRIKTLNGRSDSWWLRTAYSDYSRDFYCVSAYGVCYRMGYGSDYTSADTNASYRYGVALGFCF